MPTILKERFESVAVVTLNRPEALNAVNQELARTLLDCLQRLAADDSCRALVLTGAGRGFCAGADLMEPVGHETGPTESESSQHGSGKIGSREIGSGETGSKVFRLLDEFYNPIVRTLQEMKKPVISAVNGVAAGGGVGLALSADVILAAESATFKQVFGPQLAIIPDVGSTWYLPRTLGRARALPLMLTGDDLSARQAEEWGLIWECMPDDLLQQRALEMALRLAAGPVAAFAEIRAAVNHSQDATLDRQLDLERDVNARLCAQPEFQECLLAFKEKRTPRFGPAK